MSGNFEAWYNVPVGSTIALSVGPDGEFLASGKDDQTGLTLTHADLVPGPKTIQISGPIGFLLSVTFQGEQTETAFRAQVFDPSGNVIKTSNGDDLYDYRVEGKAGDPPAGANLVVSTL